MPRHLVKSLDLTKCLGIPLNGNFSFQVIFSSVSLRLSSRKYTHLFQSMSKWQELPNSHSLWIMAFMNLMDKRRWRFHSNGQQINLNSKYDISQSMTHWAGTWCSNEQRDYIIGWLGHINSYYSVTAWTTVGRGEVKSKSEWSSSSWWPVYVPIFFLNA